jgi:hypothetical protein
MEQVTPDAGRADCAPDVAAMETLSRDTKE